MPDYPTAIIYCPDCGVECNFVANNPFEMPFSYPGTYKPHHRGGSECLKRQIKSLKLRIKGLAEESTDENFVILLKYADRTAVVIDNSPEEAIEQARMCEPDGGWEYAITSIVARVSASRTAQVLAINRMRK